MSLSSILAEIKKLQGFATENTEDGPLSTLAARRGRKAQAIQKLNYLKEDYIKELSKNVLFIVATGAQKDEFAEIAKNDYYSFVVNPNSVFEELTSNTKIPDLLFKGKTSSVSLFDILGRHIEDMASDLNLAEYNYVIFKQEYLRALNTREELTELVKKAVVDQIGGEIVGIDAIRRIASEAIKKGHESKMTAIVLPTADDKFAQDLMKSLVRLTPKVFMVVSGKATKTAKATQNAIVLKEVNQESVKQGLKTIKGLSE